MKRTGGGTKPLLYLTSDESVFYDIETATTHAQELADHRVRKISASEAPDVFAEKSPTAESDMDSLLDALAGIQ